MWNIHKLILKCVEPLYSIYAKWQRLFFSTRAVMPPAKIHIALTYRCNCFCYFCNFAANSCEDNFTGKSYGGELSFEDIQKTVEQLPRGSFITLTGGEPTLARDFFKIVEYLTKHHKVQVNTNGVTLSKEKLERLINAKPWIIHFSLDSHDKDTHDQIRGHRGLSQRIIDSIEEIKRIKQVRGLARPYIHVNAVVLRNKADHLPELVKLCNQLGVQWLSFASMRDGRGGLYGYEDSELLYLKNKLQESKKLANEVGITLRLGEELKLIDSIRKAPLLNTQEELKREVNMSPFACYAPWVSLWIRPNGDIRICRALLGNIHKDSIKSIWNNKVARSLRKTFFFDEKEKLSQQCQGCCLIARR